MLKKFMLFVLSLALLVAPVSLAETTTSEAETREETIMLEGMEEKITTVKFDSSRGYTLWYDPETILPLTPSEGNNMDDFTLPGSNLNSYALSIHYGSWIGYSFDEAKQAAEMTFADNHDSFEIFDAPNIFTNYPNQAYAAQKDGQSFIQYVVDEGEGSFYLYLTYPTEAAEGFGDRVRHMLKSFEITKTEETESSAS